MKRPVLTVLLLPLLLAAEPVPVAVTPHIVVSVEGSNPTPVRRASALHFSLPDSRRQVVFHYSGHESLKLDDEGNLLIAAAGETIVQELPVVFQRIGPSMRLVSAEYSIGKDGEVLLRLGPRDRNAAARDRC